MNRIRTILLSLFGFAALCGATSLLGAPVAIVYPYAAGSGTDPQAGNKLATLLATRIDSLGGVKVKPPTPGIDRSKFLDDARAQNADYYVTGFLTPIGDEVSLVTQVVSTYSGIVVWSDTVQIRTYGEAQGQADQINAAILHHAGRGQASADEPSAVTNATPEPPKASPNEANISGLFRHRARASAPTPAPSPSAVAAVAPPVVAVAQATPPPRPVPTLTPAPPRVTASPAPARATPSAAPTSSPVAAASGRIAAIVAGTDGDAPADQRDYATAQVTRTLQTKGIALAPFSGGPSDPAARARQACASIGAASGTTVYIGTLSTQRVGVGSAHGTSAVYDLTTFDCKGALVSQDHEETDATGKDDATHAIDRAVAAAFDAILYRGHHRR